ncbi:hypothetical protein [Schleiferilactobacillus shenzhenensis]|uniref:Uncharacterized protein n=1 Tax=Schleiferilactobacillus shenzhenensis LY-73 TaxID=1231336 RepID=U4TLS6_9LACO|nr:hypothetical protein [Schleiferilactobacillus shenzhenensis]ERL65174.1 hypothetical protein L248_2849 [Schleiferilactobacillus shenzhenensis LY-73]
MSERPVFGPKALSNQQSGTPASTPQQDQQQASPAQTSNTGQTAANQQSNQSHPQVNPSSQAVLDAAKTAAKTGKAVVGTGLHWFGQVLKMQPAGTWIKYFLISALGFAVMLDSDQVTGQVYPLSVNIINFLLYPLTATIFRTLGDLIHHRPGQYSQNLAEASLWDMAFYGNGDGELSRGFSWVVIFFYGLRFLFFVMKYYFSYIIGPVAFLFLLHKARQANNQ